MSKKILINGSPRSGTTFLFYQMKKKTKDLCIYEPFNEWIFINLKKINKNALDVHKNYFNNKDIKYILEDYTNFDLDKIKEVYKDYLISKIPNITMLKGKKCVRKILSLYKDCNIKEISLHFYLDDPFIKENWNVFHIIRHPVDTILSIENKLYKNNILIKLTNIFKIFSYFVNRTIKPYYFLEARRLSALHGIEIPYRLSFIESWLIIWTISNFYAIQRCKNIIVYNKPETYEILPFEIKSKEIKIKKYKNNKINKKLLKYSKNLGIKEEFETLLELFI